MAQLTHEGVAERLSLLADITSHLAQANKTLGDYEGAWGPEGFIHSIVELVSTAQLTLETSIAILQDYTGEGGKKHRAPEEVEEVDPNFDRGRPAQPLRVQWHAPEFR
jgi:hypothetical protein